MLPLALAVAFFAGYWPFHYGLYFYKGAPITMLDDLLPSRRAATYQKIASAGQLSFTSQGTTGGLGQPGEVQGALAQAIADMNAACSGAGAGTAACAQAQQRVRNIQTTVSNG